MDDRIRTREAEIRETLARRTTGALASIAASPAAAAAYLAAASRRKIQPDEGARTKRAQTAGTLAMGTRDSTRVIRIVAATEKHAFLVGKETRAWEGASWPAVGFERLDRTAPPTSTVETARAGRENADPEAPPVKRPPPVRTPPGTSRVVDLEDARDLAQRASAAAAATRLRRGRFSPRRSSASETRARCADTPPGRYARWSSWDRTAGPNPGLVSEEDKMLVTRVAAVSDALAKTAAATAKERERVREKRDASSTRTRRER